MFEAFLGAMYLDHNYEYVYKFISDLFLPQFDNVTEENIEQILEQEVGKVFCKVLEDAGVYKCTDEGIKAFKRFISTL